MTKTEPLATLFIPGQLPGLNELISAAKGYGGKGLGYSKLKRKWTDSIARLAKSKKIPAVTVAQFRFLWVEPNRKRDPDNIAAGGRKLILDALVKAKVLPDDGWDEVWGWTDSFGINKHPGVRVEILAVPT